MRNNNIKKAFTLAEAIICLAVIAIVVAASTPMVTTKIKGNFAGGKENEIWQVSPKNELGLVTDKQISINGGDTNDIALNGGGSIKTTIAIKLTNPESLFNSIRDDRRLFKVGDFNFSQIKDNIFITTSDIPNPYDKYGTTSSSSCFLNDSDCQSNIILGGKFYNDGASTNDILEYATSDFKNNVLIGDGNKNINADAQNTLIAGFGNNLGATTTTTVIGNNNTSNKESQVIVGNNITPDGTTDDFVLGAGDNLPLIKITDYSSASAVSGTVKFLKPTVVTGTVVTASIIESSDRRLKNIKGEYKKGLKEILNTTPVNFSYKADETNTIQAGVIAQDLQKLFPEAVILMPNDYYGVDITPVFFATLNAIKELDKKTKYEQERFEKLKREYEELSAKEKVKKPSFTSKITEFFGRIFKRTKPISSSHCEERSDVAIH